MPHSCCCVPVSVVPWPALEKRPEHLKSGMHLHFERSPNTQCDCPLLSLTWMGKVPDEMPDEEGWKLNRTNYYQEGWLATGNVRGVVGVTFTSCHCKKVFDVPLRANYNLRGHRSEVALVKWNEPYQKLASCDSSGIIFVWIKYEGRWSIELINDRNTQVADFSWSHDGRMALICYQDDFVLVGSVAGQRYWSSMLNLEGTITCGIWTPDDQQVLFGTTDGQIIVMDVHGVMVAQVSVLDDVAISSMSWSCEKFKMEEGDDDDTTSESSRSARVLDKPSVLAVTFKNGVIYVMKNYDDVSPIVIFTGLKGLKVEWTNAGDVLAVAGCISNNNAGYYTNVVQFYTECGILRYTVHIPYVQHPVSALTWGHNDKRLFVATGPFIHVGWITRKVASLQLLSRLTIYRHVQSEEHTIHLLLPKRLKNLVVSLFSPTIKCCFPEPQLLRQFVCRPPMGGVRYHCTMIRHDDDLNLSSGTCYTLYLEYLGGLVPLLKGKRSSKIRPEFIIYNPQVCDPASGSDSSGDSGSSKVGNGNALSNGQNLNGLSDFSDSEYEDGCASPRMQRRRKQMKKLLKEQMELELRLVDNLAYMDTLPEQERLVEVTSNIWGTKFKMHGVDPHLPANLGQITYKTSLLHLQPRQMTVTVTELRDDLQPEVDPSFNPNLFSEDEDDTPTLGDDDDAECLSHLQKEGAPIAPMTPRKQITTSNGLKHHHMQHVLMPAILDRVKGTKELVRSVATISSGGLLAGPDSEPDEFPYVDFTNSPELLSLIERESKSFVREYYSNGSVAVNQRDGAMENEAVCCDRTDVAENCSGSSGRSMNSSTVPQCTQADLRFTSFVSCNGGNSAAGSPTPVHNSNFLWRLHSDTSSPKRIPNMSACSASSVSVSAISSSSLNVGPVTGKNEGSQRAHRWAEKASDFKYIDDDDEGGLEWSVCSSLPQARLLSRCRSHSVGHLNAVDVASNHDVTRAGSLREMKRRLILSQDRSPRSLSRPRLVQCGKSRSLDSGPVFQEAGAASAATAASGKDSVKKTNPIVPIAAGSCSHHRPPLDVYIHTPSPPMSPAPSPLLSRRTRFVTSSVEEHPDVGLTCKASSLTQLSFSSPSSSRPSSPLLDRNILTSTPPTPKRSFQSHQIKNSLRRKSLLNSPLLSRRSRRGKVVESSDEEIACSGDEMPLPTTYRDLESFQKAHIRRKLKKERLRHDQCVNSSPGRVHRQQFVMHNKAPLWNENSQVYQLDFGGRVTQESAKNFQIEFRGKQVMQFGRIDGNAYTLDFQYPFTAIQAFAVALANVTQRLK